MFEQTVVTTIPEKIPNNVWYQIQIGIMRRSPMLWVHNDEYEATKRSKGNFNNRLVCVCMHVWACASNSLLKCFQNINFYYYVTSVLPWIRYRGAKNELHVKLFVVQHERMNRIKMWHPYVNRYFRVAMPHTYTCLSGKIDDDNIIQMHLKYDEKKEKPKPKEKCVRRFVLFWFELAINAEYGSLSRK